MTMSLSSPITGAAQTGLTSPTYTVVSDTAPDANGKQYAVTAIGGTQTGVDTSSTVNRPWTLTFFRPKAYKVLGKPNPTTGLITSVPRNVFKFLTRKGVTPLAGQPSAVMLVETIIHIPAGADTADAANVRAALSSHLGGLAQASAGIGDTGVTGVM